MKKSDEQYLSRISHARVKSIRKIDLSLKNGNCGVNCRDGFYRTGYSFTLDYWTRVGIIISKDTMLKSNIENLSPITEVLLL